MNSNQSPSQPSSQGASKKGASQQSSSKKEEKARPATALTAESLPAHQAVLSWFASSIGNRVLQTELALLEQLLPGFFGYHLVQLSVQDRPLFAASQIQTKIPVKFFAPVITKEGTKDSTKNPDGQSANEKSGLVASPTCLPFASDSIDVVLLHHLLDFADSPLDILKEIARITLPGGHLVIAGFNPLSLWGCWRQLARLGKSAPWNGKFIRPGRLMDWLNLLDFKIDRAQYAIYKPPLMSSLGAVPDYSQGFSRNLNMPVGAVYVISASKQVGAVTPMRPIWKRQGAFGRLTAVPSAKRTLE